jgi:hypothetical protein
MSISRSVIILCLLTAVAIPASASPCSELIPMPGYLILPPKGDQWDRELSQE